MISKGSINTAFVFWVGISYQNNMEKLAKNIFKYVLYDKISNIKIK